MPEYTTIKINRTNHNQSPKAFISNINFQKPSSIKKVHLEIKLNVSLQLKEVELKTPYSNSVTFRLNNSEIKENENQPITSEPYFNPALLEKFAEFKPKLHANLSYNNLIDPDMALISQHIILEKKCTELWLYGNHITSKGIALLAPSLKNNSTLKCLDLSFNQISDLGVKFLCEALLPKENSSLKVLYLSKNMILCDGAKYLSEMLRTNQILKELWLSENEITDQGLKQLTDVLIHHNKTLKFLSLSINKFITDLSIDNLIEMLQQNRTLKKLWIKDCDFSEQGKLKLQEFAKRKKNFQIEL